jgi:hypothetical protein
MIAGPLPARGELRLAFVNCIGSRGRSESQVFAHESRRTIG